MKRWFACIDCGNTEELEFPDDKYATDRLTICCSGCGQDEREYMRLFGDLTGDHSFGFGPEGSPA